MKIKFINNTFEYFTDFTINLSYSSIASTFSFSALNSILGQPLVYSNVKIYNDEDELLITGYILSSGFKISEKPEKEIYPGYSITGVLEDCTIPFPVQFDKLTLREITTQLLKPYGLGFVVSSSVATEMDKVYEKSIAGDSQSVKDYLTELASQRGIILTHNSSGQIVFTKIDVSKLKAVAQFIEGEPGSTDISLTANGQSMHSEITVVRQSSAENPDSGEYTINNPYVTNRYRPKRVILSSGDIFDIQTAARNELAMELTGIELIVQSKKFIRPGSIIEVKSDRLKLKKLTRFFVDSCDIKGEVNSIKYTLKCVLPDVYSTGTVRNIFI